MAKSIYISNLYNEIDDSIESLIEIMEELEHTSHGFNGVVVYNNKMTKWLIENKVAGESSRGALYRGSEWKTVYDKVFDEYYNHYIEEFKNEVFES